MSNLNYILAFDDLSGQKPPIGKNLDEIDPRRDGGKVNTFFLKSNQNFLALNIVNFNPFNGQRGIQNEPVHYGIRDDHCRWILYFRSGEHLAEVEVEIGFDGIAGRHVPVFKRRVIDRVFLCTENSLKIIRRTALGYGLS